MIFVTLGTQDKPFDRLIAKIDELIKKGIIKDDVIIQAGSTDYKSEKMKIISVVPQKKFEDYIKKSDFVITHGGVGSIIDAMRNSKKVIAVARRKKYNEIISDHQIQVIKKFSDSGYIIGCNEVDDLEDAIRNIKRFKPKDFNNDNSKMIDIIQNFIENN